MKKEGRTPVGAGKVWIVFSLLLLFACSEEDDFLTKLNFDQEAYTLNRQLWQDLDIKSYEFVQEYSSTTVGGQPKVKAIVNNSTLDTMYAMSEINENTVFENLNCYESITEVYDFIDMITKSCEESINSSKNPMKGANIEVQYHEFFHYPTKINCTGFYSDGLMGGLSILIQVDDFEVD